MEQLESRVKEAAASGKIADALDMLNKLELEVELLKKQCKQPRKYVACGVEGTSDSPSRKRRILVKITNSVTTIIKVVEKELQRQGQLQGQGGARAALPLTGEQSGSDIEELSQLHRKLSALHVNASDVEGDNDNTTISEMPSELPSELTTPIPETTVYPESTTVVQETTTVHSDSTTVPPGSSTVIQESSKVTTVPTDQSTVIPETSVTLGFSEDRDENLEALLVSAGNAKASLDALIVDPHTAEQSYDDLLTQNREVRSNLEKALVEIDNAPTKTASLLLYREQVVDLIEKLIVSSRIR